MCICLKQIYLCSQRMKKVRSPWSLCQYSSRNNTISQQSYKMNLIWILISLCCYSQLCTASKDGDSINYNECETKENGKVAFNACTSSPAYLFAGENLNFTVKISPSDYTCGLSQAEKYCTLESTDDCGYCNKAVESQNHPADFLVDQLLDGQNFETFWQSITWREYPTPLEINITISFDKSYELQNDIKITFKSARPRRMVLEKSHDFGLSWEVWQYYDSSCGGYFTSGIASRNISVDKPETVICEEYYSYEIPYEDGQVIFPITNERLGLYLGHGLTEYPKLYQAYNDTNIKQFLTFTDIRIRLLQPMTDGHEDMGNFIKYYYAISDVEVTASCSCNLHAKYCNHKDGRTACECQHNTAGVNCEMCLPLYNNKPWKPGYYVPYPGGTANPCEKCECNDHSDSCTYNETLGHGQCDQCYHNTEGLHCEHCTTGYYRNNTLQLNDPSICVECDCYTHGALSERSSCDKVTGQCSCKHNFTSRDCSQCEDGFFNFPECVPCNCNKRGSVSLICDKVAGNCSCHASVSGMLCDATKPSYFVPAIDTFQFQPFAGTCTIRRHGNEKDQHITNSVSASCEEEQYVDFKSFYELDGIKQPEIAWTYLPAVRYSFDNSTFPWKSAILQFTTNRNLSRYCANIDTHHKTLQLTINGLESGKGKAWLSDKSISLDLRCLSNIRLVLLNKGESSADLINIDSVLLLPDPSTIPGIQGKDNHTEAPNYKQCLSDFAALNTKDTTALNKSCSDMAHQTMSFLFPVRQACNCDRVGTIPDTVCNPTGGSCQCKPGVYGRKCNKCLPGYHSFTASGCLLCSTPECSSRHSSYKTTPTLIHHSSTNVIITVVMLFVLTFVTMLVMYVIISPQRREKCLQLFPAKKPSVAYIDMDDDGDVNGVGNHMKHKKVSKVGYQSFINEPDSAQDNVPDKTEFEELKLSESSETFFDNSSSIQQTNISDRCDNVPI